MDDINAEQVRRNQDSRQGWELYTAHRERVTELLLAGVSRPEARLCVLGAGNCNDLDLNRLRQTFREIHLVDLDPAALEAGCVQQCLAQDPGIIRHPGIDVTGILPILNSWRPDQPVDEHVVQEVIHKGLLPQLFGLDAASFDVVASVGLLTQLIDAAALTLGVNHPQYVNLMTSIRLRHLRLLLELTRPGGISWLFTEIVASTTCPELLTVPIQQLQALLNRCIEDRNFFTGCHPGVIAQQYQRDPQLVAKTGSVAITPPWRWQFFTRTYGVCAIAAGRK